MKVGDRIRVFEVQSGHYQTQLIGKHSAERLDKYFGNKYGVNLCYGFTASDGGYVNHHGNIENEHIKVNHLKQVCTMVIKSIKNA